MDLWTQNLIDPSLQNKAEVIEKLNSAVSICRRAVDHARVLMHNGNFIDAENAWQHADEFAKFALSLTAALKDSSEEANPGIERLKMEADCLLNVVRCLKFDIQQGKVCHFTLAQAKSQSTLL